MERMVVLTNFASDTYILSGIFATKGCRIHLLLTKENLSWEIENVPKSQTIIPLRCLIAANPCNCTALKQTKPLRCYFCRDKKFSSIHSSTVPKAIRLYFAVPFGRHKWKLNTQLFKPIENTNLFEWINIIHKTLSELNRPRNLLVFVNPYGGKKKGIKIYEQKVAPIFLLAEIESNVVVTQSPNHAKEMIEDIDILKYDGIICVGGDGMFNEILNSVLRKTQKEKGIDVNDVYNSLVTPHIPFGIIPAGTTNAAVHSITGSSDPLSATLLIVMGEYTGVDVCGMYTSGNLSKFAATFLSYGYFGDVARDSEKLRWLGPKRYSITGFKKILCRKIYEGELQLLVDVPTNHSFEKERCYVNCDTCLKAAHECNNEKSPGKIRWLSVRGQFLAVSGCVISCACSKSPKGVSQYQHLGNGYCDLIIVKACSRLNYLRFLLRVAHHHKDPFDLNFVEVFRVKEFKFNPFVTDDKTPAVSCIGVYDNWQELNTSVWNCDGEVITEPSITVRTHCQLVNVFGRGYEDRKKDSILSQCFKFFRKS